jgi:hypothetical protein
LVQIYEVNDYKSDLWIESDQFDKVWFKPIKFNVTNAIRSAIKNNDFWVRWKLFHKGL